MISESEVSRDEDALECSESPLLPPSARSRSDGAPFGLLLVAMLGLIMSTHYAMNVPMSTRNGAFLVAVSLVGILATTVQAYNCLEASRPRAEREGFRVC